MDQVTEILHCGHFLLFKWHSNHALLIENCAKKDFNTCDNGLTSALGVSWNQYTDMLLFHFKPKIFSSTVTKRTIQSIASALFDPLELVSLIIVVRHLQLRKPKLERQLMGSLPVERLRRNTNSNAMVSTSVGQ
ncbi:GH10278 [Drosophila grimshawi]|uniref:GH10278 n=1 Tax=Drosophila grimshawi TaxID=7222 RepID=B4K0U4_DROGR|nr:GH10278 [Drosophila grimshawi]